MERVLHDLIASARARETAALSDAELLEAFLARREERAFEALVRRHGPMVLGVCRRVLGNCHDAEDAFQATFLVLVRKAASVRPRELLGHWLYGVAYRTSLRTKGMNAKRRAKEHNASLHTNRPTAPPAEVWDDVAPLLDRELAHLPEKYRTPIILCEVQGKSRREAARVLNLPEGTLSSRLAMAKRLLARRLSARGVSVSGAILGGILGERTATAAVPASLLGATIKIAMPVAAGQALTGGVVPAKVATLTESVLKAMIIAKLKIATSVVLLIGLLGGGIGWLAMPIRAGDPPAVGKQLPGTIALGPADERSASQASKFGEGWKKIVPISEPALGKGDSYCVWVEDGWLQVKRQAKDGRIDWQIVLARAVDTTPPAVTTKEGFIFEVSYKRGRYFVRETRNVIQSLREPKPGKGGTRPLGEFIDGTFQSTNSGGAFPDADPVLTLWRNPAWVIVTSAPMENRIDSFIRLDAADKLQGSGAQSFRGTLRKCTWGADAWVLDDGESLTATRRPVVDIEQERKLQAARAALKNAPAPELQAESWLNGRGLGWPALRGKVVLLDFWIATCSPCVESLSRAQVLQNKLRKRGFVVIGVINAGDSKQIRDILYKQGASFPVAIVADKTLEKFGVDGVPAYYLIGRDGRVASGLTRALPEENELEVLLGK